MSWSSLGRLLHLEILRVAYLSFFLAPAVAAVVNWANRHGLSIEFPLTIALTYLAGMSFSASMAIYDLFAPAAVRLARSEEDFVTARAREHEVKRTEVDDLPPLRGEPSLRLEWRTANTSLAGRRAAASLALLIAGLASAVVLTLQILSIFRAVFG